MLGKLRLKHVMVRGLRLWSMTGVSKTLCLTDWLRLSVSNVVLCFLDTIYQACHIPSKGCDTEIVKSYGGTRSSRWLKGLRVLECLFLSGRRIQIREPQKS